MPTAHLLVAAALAPAAFTALSFTGPIAWDGLLSFWVKNIAIAVILAALAALFYLITIVKMSGGA